MDLFHTITQEIESVLSCHWLTEFRQTSNSNRNSANNTPSATRRSSSSSTSSTSSILGQTKSISDIEANKAKMSNTGGLMDTEAGGEQTQYEGIKTFTKPHSKQEGQLGGDSQGTTTDTSGVDSDRAQKTTENIRYGQNISESGMGGMTTTSGGEANQEGGYGGTEASAKLESGGNERSKQGYSAGSDDHDYNVGA